MEITNIKTTNFKKKQALNDSLPEVLERLIATPGVDWTGKLISKYEHTFKPIPRIDRNSPIFQLIVDWGHILQIAMEPANPDQILFYVGKLHLHFRGSKMSEREHEIVFGDYLADLSHLPLDLIILTCDQYRQDGSNEYFPKSGRLRTMANAHLYTRVCKLNKLQALKEATLQEQPTQKASVAQIADI